MITFVIAGALIGGAIFGAGIWLGFQLGFTPEEIDLGNLHGEGVES